MLSELLFREKPHKMICLKTYEAGSRERIIPHQTYFILGPCYGHVILNKHAPVDDVLLALQMWSDSNLCRQAFVLPPNSRVPCTPSHV